MTNMRNQSLGELEKIYREKHRKAVGRRAELEKQVQEVEREIMAHEQNLRYVQALIGGRGAAIPPATPPPSRRQQRRKRKSPVKTATLQVLLNRPGQWLTMAQIKTAIRKDTHKRVSRQSINVNMGLLEAEGLVRRKPAPRGAGARFVFAALPSS